MSDFEKVNWKSDRRKRYEAWFKEHPKVTILASILAVILIVIAIPAEDPSTQNQPIKKENNKFAYVEQASSFCQLAKLHGIALECDLNVWEGAIDMRSDASVGIAQQICNQAVQSTNAVTDEDQKWHFGSLNKLRVFSPFSGDHPLAICYLPE